MVKIVGVLLVVGLYTWCNGQTPARVSTTQSPVSTKLPPLPEERGLIITVFHASGDTDAAQLRHLPMFPGYENFSGLVPGIAFSNPNIHLLSIDVDFREKQIFAYDYHLRSVVVGHGYNKDLNVSNMEFDLMHVGVSRGTVQIAYDWLSKTLYWSDYTFRWIVAAPTQKKKIENDYYVIIADTHLDGPDGLAVDPMEGYLFWSDNGKHPKIERSDMMGKKRHTIVYKDLVSPLTLEADHIGKRILWIDTYTDSILMVPYEGGKVTQIQRIPASTLLDLAVFREVVYVSDIKNSDVYTLNMTEGIHLGKSESTDISIYPEIIYGLAVYSDETQPVKDRDYCADKDCDHVCVSTKNGAECLCSVGYSLNSTTGKCEEREELRKAIVTANATHICLMDIRSLAHVYYEYVCKFTVIKQTTQPMTSTPPVSQRRRRQVQSTPTSTRTTQTMTPPSTVRTTPAPTAAPTDLIKMFDMDMEDRIFYFVTADNSIYKRLIDLPIENDAKELLVKASGTVSGLAFDFVDKNNLFWCESDTGLVKVIDTMTMASTQVNTDGVVVESPRDVIVYYYQKKGRLAMLSVQKGEVAIQTMTMDGQDFKKVVSDREIAAFTFDKEKNVFYYVSGTSIYSVRTDGSNKTPVTNNADSNIFELVLYKNYLNWLFTTTTYTHLVRTYDITTDTSIALGYFDNSSIVDMKVLDFDYVKLDYVSPCAYENGNCSQICVMQYTNGMMRPLCECRLGYNLAADGKSCISSVIADNFLLVTDWTNEELQQINLLNNEINVIPDTDSTEYMGVYFDPDMKKVILAEYYDNEIISMNLNGTERKVFSDLGFSGYAYRFDKDLTTKNLYYTAYVDTYIGTVVPSGEYIILKDDFRLFEYLNDIVVHPGKGWMYYAVLHWSSPYIGRADMDGKNSVRLITGNHVDKPDGLAIDYAKDHLYWSDASFDTIIQCNLNGENCVTIVNKTSTYNNEEIRDLVIDGNFLYYTAYKKDHVVRIDLSKSDYRREVVGQSPGLGKLDTMTIYNSKSTSAQSVSPGCKERNGLGDCSTICLPTPTGRTCACEKGTGLKADGRTCANVYQCTDVIMQTVQLITNETVTIDVTFDESCLRHLNNKCHYQCPMNFLPVQTTLLTCTNVGWDKESLPLCKEIRCPATIANGMIDQSCKREIGEKCNYTCNSGFTQTQSSAVCTKSENAGVYHLPDEEFCAPFKCSDNIKNGILDKTCTRNISSTCPYTCDKYYTSADKKSTATCRATGWNPVIPCIEIRCPATIANGMIDQGCKHEIGEKCNYTCNSGFTKTQSSAVCTKSENAGVYHLPDEEFCAPFKCSDNIKNGILDKTCTRNIGSTCPYTCDKYYTSADKKSTATCKATGWNPVIPCIDRKCADVSLANGVVSNSCMKKVGEACSYKCNSGFMNTTALTVCKNDYKWHPEDSCKPAKCPSTIPNGNIDVSGSCDLSVGSKCSYICNRGFQAADLNAKLMCQNIGQWNFTNNVCLEVSVRPAKQTSENDLSVPGVTAGVVVLILIIIALVVAVIFLIRRSMNKSSSNYATASFRQNGTGDGISIENPGYLQSNEPTVQIKDEHPYSSVDPSQMQPVTFSGGAAAADDGISNPLYDKEPLPDVSHVDMNQDKTVLTYDSWLKEREKEK